MEEILKLKSVTKIFQLEKDHSISFKDFLKPRELLFRKKPELCAVNNVSFTLYRSECLGIVGETGAGKTTLCGIISRLLEASCGEIYYHNQDIAKIPPFEFAKSDLRKKLQMMFQDPTEALNPAFTAFRTIANPITSLLKWKDKAAIEKKVKELAEKAYFPLRLLDRYPHQLSGGEKARVGIARALATDPELLVLDEPTSALDVSVQGAVLILLEQLRKDFDISYLFISHDLSVTRLMCERVLIMQKGSIIEEGTVEEIFKNPKEQHTRDLIDSIPNLLRRE
jgi:peptide/nickel transport system ATP-binding protein